MANAEVALGQQREGIPSPETLLETNDLSPGNDLDAAIGVSNLDQLAMLQSRQRCIWF